jgi:hypothetical protein
MTYSKIIRCWPSVEGSQDICVVAYFSSSSKKKQKEFLGSQNFCIWYSFGRMSLVVEDFLPDSDCQCAATTQKIYVLCVHSLKYTSLCVHSLKSINRSSVNCIPLNKQEAHTWTCLADAPDSFLFPCFLIKALRSISTKHVSDCLVLTDLCASLLTG